jgi:predicted nucleic acid-binding protein
MALLLDTSLWIDFTRTRTPLTVKQLIAPFVLDAETHLAEPVVFEVLRFAAADEARQLEAQFATLPMLATPRELWRCATELGQACRSIGATIVSFDRDYEAIARVSSLNLQLISRPG